MGSPAQNPDSWSTVESVLETVGLTSCSVRLWSIKPKDLDWSSGHAAVCLIADLLTAGSGHLVQGTPTELVAHFDRPESALNAARRLQRALYAFTEGQETAGFGASIVIHRPEDQVRPGPLLPVREVLWSQCAAPGQILVSVSAHEILQFVPGLQFHPIPAEDVSSAPAYQELLWIDPQALAAWRSRVVAASRIALPPDQESDATIPEVETEPAVSRAGTVANQNGERIERPTSGIANSQNRLWIAAAVVLVVLISLGVVFRVKHGKGNGATALQQLNRKTGLQLPPSRGEDSAGSTQPVEEHLVSSEKIKTEPTQPPPPVKPHKQNRELETGALQYDGFTVKQIPQLIKKAEKDAGAGRYEDAQREYKIVLKLQPGNVPAQEGLRKLRWKMDEQR